MKKGFLTLTVALLTLVVTLGFGAVPSLLQIPDVQIGDLEDAATSANLFVFPNAFNFDNYWGIASTGTMGTIQFIYQGEAPTTSVITINGLKSAAGSYTNDAYAVSHFATLKNIKCSPPGGQYTAHPVGTSTPIVVTLAAQNSLSKYARNTGSFSVLTVAGGYDSILTFKRVHVTSTALASIPSPAWSFVAYNLTTQQAPPVGIRACNFGHSTTGGYYLQNHFQNPSNDTHNEFGFWSIFNTTNPIAGQTLIPYTSGYSYIVQAKVYALPHVTTTAMDIAPSPKLFIPWIRVRMNAANESISEEMDINPYGTANCEVSSDPAHPTVETLVWDPRDQTTGTLTGRSADHLNKVYFSFDMIDFNKRNDLFPGSEPQDGLVGIQELDVDSFQTRGVGSLFAKPTLVTKYPASGTFGNMLSAFSKTQTGYGTNPVDCTTDTAGNLAFSDINVARGFGIFQLSSSALAVNVTTTAKWYLYQFKVVLNSGDPYWLRLRVFYGDNQRSVNYGVHPGFNGDGTRNDYQFADEPFQATAVYNVFMVPKVGEIYPLYWAFDYIDFDSTAGYGDASISLTEVDVKQITPPTFN